MHNLVCETSVVRGQGGDTFTFCRGAEVLIAIAGRLNKQGLSRDGPAAVIAESALPDQSVVCGT
ncbi:MAG: hypothetical protein OEW27_05590, partial [Aquincola sp.]|nr:hypothetical protein [Aquincola sp.]